MGCSVDPDYAWLVYLILNTFSFIGAIFVIWSYLYFKVRSPSTLQVIYISGCDAIFSLLNLLSISLAKSMNASNHACLGLAPLTFLFETLSIGWAGALAISAAIANYRLAKRQHQLTHESQRWFHLVWVIVICANIPMFLHSDIDEVRMSSSLSICHWRDSNENGKYSNDYSVGYRVTDIIQLVLVSVSLAANLISLVFIRIALRNAPQVVRDRQTARLERYMMAFLVVWSLRVTSNSASCHDIYPGPGNITYWIWLSPGAWGIVNALILGTSRTSEAKEYFTSCLQPLCCNREGDSLDSDGNSTTGASSSFNWFVIFRPSLNEVREIRNERHHRKKKKLPRGSAFVRPGDLPLIDDEESIRASTNSGSINPIAPHGTPSSKHELALGTDAE